MALTKMLFHVLSWLRHARMKIQFLFVFFISLINTPLLSEKTEKTSPYNHVRDAVSIPKLFVSSAPVLNHGTTYLGILWMAPSIRKHL